MASITPSSGEPALGFAADRPDNSFLVETTSDWALPTAPHAPTAADGATRPSSGTNTIATSLPPGAVEIALDQRDDWLRDRKRSVGASEVWDVCLGDPIRVWALKRGLLEPRKTTFRQEMGLALEPVLAALYEEETGASIAYHQIFRHDPARPHVSATVDAMTTQGVGVEFKTVDPRDQDTIDTLDGDRLPDRWLFQTQQQMHVFDWREMDVFALIGFQRFIHLQVTLHDVLRLLILAKLDRFWPYVVEGTKPPGRTLDIDLHRVLNPTCEGFCILSQREAKWADEFEQLSSVIRQAERLREERKADLLDALGSSATGELPDGRVVTRKIITVRQEPRPAKVTQHVRLAVKETR